MEKLYVSNYKEIIEKVKTNGVCIIKNYVDNQKLNKIEKEFDDILDKYKIYLDDNYEPNRCLRTNLNTEIINQNNNYNIYSLFANQFVLNIANNILGNFKSDNIFIHHDYKNINSNNTHPHFDYDRKLKFYLCVNDMNKTNGCFKVLPNKMDLVEEKRKINRRNNIFTPDHKFYNGTEIKIEELIPLECKGGDLIIFDTNCIHAGGDSFEEEKYRKVIRLHLSNISKTDIYKTNIKEILNINKQIKGNYIELGTFKGKGTIIMGNFIKNNNLQKKIFTFDTFSGYMEKDIILAKTEKEKKGLIENQKKRSWCIDKQIVVDKINNNKLNNIVEIFKGDISNTIKNIHNQLISLIFVDCNAYNPAFNALKHLNKQINHCCFIIVDEHQIGGETAALNEFIEKFNIKGSLFKLNTNYLTGPRIIFNVDKSTNQEMKQQWIDINNILKNKYREIAKLGNSNENDIYM